jgi:hypothetical protein
MITKRAHLQFDTLIAAAQHESLCVAECFNIKTGKKEYVLCAHHLENGVVIYNPLAKLFQGNPNNEVTAPGQAQYKLI